MGDTNTKRIEHPVDEEPNSYRGRSLKQIINDLGEEDTGKGFSEIIKNVSPPFVGSIITWADNTKTLKRTETTFNRDGQGVFVESIVKEILADDGTTVLSTITTLLNRDGNKQVTSADVTVTRP